MSADFEARRVAAEVMADFDKMFPGSNILPIERQYISVLVAHHVCELLRMDEDDGR